MFHVNFQGWNGVWVQVTEDGIWKTFLKYMYNALFLIVMEVLEGPIFQFHDYGRKGNRLIFVDYIYGFFFW